MNFNFFSNILVFVAIMESSCGMTPKEWMQSNLIFIKDTLNSKALEFLRSVHQDCDVSDNDGTVDVVSATLSADNSGIDFVSQHTAQGTLKANQQDTILLKASLQGKVILKLDDAQNEENYLVNGLKNFNVPDDFLKLMVLAQNAAVFGRTAFSGKSVGEIRLIETAKLGTLLDVKYKFAQENLYAEFTIVVDSAVKVEKFH